MKTNIAIICQLKIFKKQVAKAFADKLEMFYVDTDELMNFDNISMEELLEKQGSAYYNKIEKETIENVAGFENSVITTGTNSIFSTGCIEKVKQTSILVYLQIPFNIYKKEKSNDQVELNKSKLILDEMVFSERDKIYIKNCDLVAICKKASIKLAVKQIIKSLKKGFEKTK